MSSLLCAIVGLLIVPSLFSLKLLGENVLYAAVATTLRTHQGSNAAENLGGALAGIGDVNQDGFDDYLIGSRYDSAQLTKAGKAVVYSGKDGAVLFSKSGALAGDLFGSSVAAVGDIDQDGVGDFAVTAMQLAYCPIASCTSASQLVDPGAGYVMIFSGSNFQLIKKIVGVQLSGNFGNEVIGVGDINNDGRNDFAIADKAEASLVGQNSLTGVVRLYSGHGQANFPLLCTLRPTHAAAGIEAFGSSLSYVGDVTGGGKGMLLIGAPEYTPPSNCPHSSCNDSGEAELFALDVNQGCPYVSNFVGTQYAGNRFGAAVAGTGDLNGDGKMEFAIGEDQADYDPQTLLPSPNRNNGAVDIYTYNSTTGHFQLLRRLVGASNSVMLGSAISSVGDIDGDGIYDLLVGGRGRVNGVDLVGRARLYAGADLANQAIHSSQLLPLFENFGTGSGELFGYTVANGGDIDGDAVNDWLVAAIHNGLGAVEVLSSCGFSSAGCFANPNGHGGNPPAGGPQPPSTQPNQEGDDDSVSSNDVQQAAVASGGCGTLPTPADRTTGNLLLIGVIFTLYWLTRSQASR